MRWAFALACIAAAFPQAADYANSGYKTAEARERVAKALVAHDRVQTQRPRELVVDLQLKPGMTVTGIGTGAGFMLPYLAEAVGPAGRSAAVPLQERLYRPLRIIHRKKKKLNRRRRHCSHCRSSLRLRKRAGPPGPPSGSSRMIQDPMLSLLRKSPATKRPWPREH